ncbi:MAG: hypothetical protein FJ247_01580 [Nitrospira sp.]|nr:hypothetical protein [Nitrospira sp.]
MATELLWRVSRDRCLMVGLIGLMSVWFGGCASEPPKSSGATMTPEQVRSHADKGFDKLKQEEQHRTVSPAGAH